MSTARDPCPNCHLPFYTDRNEHCPYCGTAGVRDGESSDGDDTEPAAVPVDTTPAGSVRRERPPDRPRTTCSRCGLAHYADDDGGCPYCAAAAEQGSQVASTPDESATRTEPEPAQPAAGAGNGGDRSSRRSSGSGGLLSRLLGIFGR